jgi:signal recognition particle receptor subunit beta
MEILRLVVTGPVGAGKSTFIRTISEVEAIDTDRVATDETAQIKARTTVAFDFGRLQFADDMALHIYGTPGQSRFNFMWDMLIHKAHAYVLLVGAHQPSEFFNARRIMNFMEQRVQVPRIIGVTHTDTPNAWSADNVAIALGYTDPQKRPPMVVVNADDADSVAQAVITVIQQMMQEAYV